VLLRLQRNGATAETLLARLRENDRVLESWREAYAARSQQVVELRLRSADLAEKEAKLTAEVQTLTDENARRHHAWAAATFDLAAERAQHESASKELEKERELSARALGERDVLSREAGELREQRVRLQTDLEEATRREKRAAEEAATLQSEIDRARERLEKARADYADLRASHALLFIEIAETRADLGRSAELVDELEAELDRLRALQSPDFR
jgi:chromosome segregation ATPase